MAPLRLPPTRDQHSKTTGWSSALEELELEGGKGGRGRKHGGGGGSCGEGGGWRGGEKGREGKRERERIILYYTRIKVWHKSAFFTNLSRERETETETERQTETGRKVHNKKAFTT